MVSTSAVKSLVKVGNCGKQDMQDEIDVVQLDPIHYFIAKSLTRPSHQASKYPGSTNMGILGMAKLCWSFSFYWNGILFGLWGTDFPFADCTCVLIQPWWAHEAVTQNVLHPELHVASLDSKTGELTNLVTLGNRGLRLDDIGCIIMWNAIRQHAELGHMMSTVMKPILGVAHICIAPDQRHQGWCYNSLRFDFLHIENTNDAALPLGTHYLQCNLFWTPRLASLSSWQSMQTKTKVSAWQRKCIWLVNSTFNLQ